MLINILKKIIFTTFALASILVISSQGLQATASTTSQAIGESKTFTITYNNTQNEVGANPMLLKIYIGDKLDVVLSSFKDTFDSASGATPYCINPSFVSINTEPGWGYFLQYAPRSSTTAVPSNGVCTTGGTSTSTPTDITVGKVGTITFTASMKNTAVVGETQNPATAVAGKYQGIRAVIVTTVAGQDFNASSDLLITVTATSPTPSDPDLTSGEGSVGTSTDCVASTDVVIGQTYSCSWPINGAGPFTLPTGGIQAKTNQDSNNSAPISTCSVTGSVLTCTAISSTATPAVFTPGSGNVQLGKGTSPTTWHTKSTLNLVTASTLINLTSCTPDGSAIRISTTYSCTFSLTGTGPFTLPTGGIKARTNQGDTNSTPISCAVSGAILTCSDIQTNGSFTPASANIQLGEGATTTIWKNKGNVTLTVANNVLPRTGGFEIVAIGLAVAGVVGGAIYLVIRKRQLKD